MHMHSNLPAAVSTATAAVSMMVSTEEKSQLAKSTSILTAQHNFHHTYRTDIPVSKVIQSWFNQFKESATVEKQKSPRWKTSEEDAECMTLSCRDPKKSTAHVCSWLYLK
jgi:capsular polysaccharide biosynthesis protein